MRSRFTQVGIRGHYINFGRYTVWIALIQNTTEVCCHACPYRVILFFLKCGLLAIHDE